MVDRIRSRMAPGDTLVLSGSLVEGLGNPRSDLDFYLIADAPEAVRMAMSQSSYVDCELVPPESLDRLADSLSKSLDGFASAAVELSDIDRYYRISIGFRVVTGAPRHREILERFDKNQACSALRSWASLRSLAYSARARIAAADGAVRRAAVFARDAAIHRVVAELADRGEGYASLKWTMEKAQRAYGADSAEFRRVRRLLEFPAAPDGLDGYIEDCLSAAEAGWQPDLAASDLGDIPSAVRARVQLLDYPVFGGNAVLTVGRSTVTKVAPEETTLVRHLLAGSPVDAAAAVRASVPMTTAESFALTALTTVGLLKLGSKG
jgi:hypothetical protein